MNRLIFATNNQNKVEEVKIIVGSLFNVVSLREAGIDVNIPEPYSTLQENAREKSATIYKITGANCFSEDTGLEVDALNGEPGVHSARYSGEGNDARSNIQKLLKVLSGVENRQARFRTVICLILNGAETYFEGICEGEILEEQKGNFGFGYDSVFMPLGSRKTFGEMDLNEKNQFSHRRKATEKLAAFLSYYGNK